jgi:hypothetical protein
VVPPRPTWKLAVAAALACAALAPGWSGTLVPVAHDDVLAAASRSRSQLGVSRPGEAGEEWHVQYLDSYAVRWLDELGLRRRAPWLVAPDFVAHVPPAAGGVVRADAYFRVETRWHWPWWRPGGGVAWTMPAR